MVLTIPAMLSYGMTEDIHYTAGSGNGSQCFPNCIQPQEAHIQKGNTITWYNDDTVGHTATSGDLTNGGTVFDSSLIRSGGTYSFTFYNDGVYDFYDMVHPYITGTIYVGNSTNNPTNLPPTTPPQNPPPTSTTSSDAQIQELQQQLNDEIKQNQILQSKLNSYQNIESQLQNLTSSINLLTQENQKLESIISDLKEIIHEQLLTMANVLHIH